MPSNVWDDITYPFLNFNISDFFIYFYNEFITYPWLG